VYLMYDYARLPKDRSVLGSVAAAAERLFRKLSALDVNALPISDYNRKYLGAKLASLTNTCQLYSFILSWALAGTRVPLNQLVFVDNGGGSGVLSLLASELGIGTVVYNDIYDVSCHDAQVIGEAVGNKASYYVHGDIDELLTFLAASRVSTATQSPRTT